MKFSPVPFRFTAFLAASSLSFLAGPTAEAALLAYEPFTNAAGTSIIGSADGFGFSSAWQNNNSGGVATNTTYGLSYSDTSGNTLIASDGAGFFQGQTSGTSNMQPIRLFGFSRGTNGTDGVSTWISFIAVRQGPTVAGNNPYPRGANVPHDINSGAVQKLAIGNSSGAPTNTVGLIPLGNASNLKASTVLFSVTNFIVVRVDHISTAFDNAYLFINPNLGTVPADVQANTNSLGAFDFSFDRLRMFAGGNASAAQPYAEMVIDEYRIGETYADVTPHTSPAPAGPLIITNVVLIPGNVVGNIVLSGKGGSNNGAFYVLANSTLSTPSTTWPAVATNSFDANGNFSVTNPVLADAQFFRIGPAPVIPLIAPSITTHPTNQTKIAGQSASFIAAADGSPLLRYQWFQNTNSAVAGATNASLILNNVQAANAGAYFLRVTNAAGSATSAVAMLTVYLPPTINLQPIDQGVIISNNASFSVAASGTAPLACQWYFDTNTTIAWGTSSALTITNASTNAAGMYSVIITNNYGAVTSSFARLTVSETLITNGAFFVSPSGNDTNPGTLNSPFKTISKGHTAVGTGGQIYLRGGTYPLTSKLSLNKNASPTNYIRIWAYPGETPLIDCTGISSGDGIGISGKCYHLKGLEQKSAEHNGINISGHSNIVENCRIHDNGNTGVHITGGQSSTTFPSYNLILNCDSYLNYDAPAGENADGFSAKWDMGPGNIFSGCRAATNSDDGWDLWMATSPIVIENCWAYRNGVDVWFSGSFDGNGNGFKLGGNGVATPHITRNCVSFENEGGPTGAGRGFDENNNLAGQTLFNCIAYNNRGNNFHMQNTVTNGQHLVRNCVSYDGGVNITSGVRDHNSWQGFTVTAADFLSLDTNLANTPRNADGTLPVVNLLRLAPASSLINAGIDVGLPYNGPAPDLGAFETAP